jgi:hypothetical protein
MKVKNKKKPGNFLVIKTYKGEIPAAEVLFRIIKLAIERMDQDK